MGVWERVRAFTRGERDAELLYAYKRARTQVHTLLDAAERRRLGQAVTGAGPFDMPAAAGMELVCIWNAFVLQTLGDRMLEADEADDPATAGFVPPVTYDQVQAYYTGAQRWLAHASRAGQDPSFTVPETLPAALPAWSPVEPCPRAHLGAMLAALRSLGLHTEAAMNEQCATPTADQARLARLRGQYAQAAASARYALGMYRPDAGDVLHEKIETRVKAALENFYRVGQLLSYPALLGRVPEAPRRTGAEWPTGVLPGQPGFDPWVMTDPHTADSLRRNPQAARAIAEMWALDPDPRASLGLWQDIKEARARGAVTSARYPGGVLVGSYFCTPYADVYEAAQAVVIGDIPVPGASASLTIECAAEGVRLGYPFKREVVLGQFRAAQIDYCDPDAPPPHDD